MQPSTWIFQANPKLYDIHDSLKLETRELWGCKQHKDKIRKDDRVLIWISGSKAGIYAVGTVLTDPSPQPDTPSGMSYWNNPLEGLDDRPRVWVQYEKILLDQPLLKEFLRCDPELWDLRIMHKPMGTNFPVKDHEWLALKSWLNL